MKAGISLILIILGAIPVIFLKPFDRCWNAFQAIPFMAGFISYLTLLIFILFFCNIYLKEKVSLWKIGLIGVCMIGLQFLFFKIENNTFTQPISVFESEIDHKKSYHYFRLSLLSNNNYRLDRINQFGGCFTKGNYSIEDSLIVFDENLRNFSWYRLGNPYRNKLDKLEPITEIDTLQLMSLKKVK